MRSPFAVLLLLIACLVPLLQAQIVVEEAEVLDDPLEQGPRSNVSIGIRTTFPDSAVNTLGMFYNGRTSRVDVSIYNNETEPITVHFIGGAFLDLATLKPVHNLTAKTYNSAVQPKEEQIFPFSVQTYFPGPRVLHLSLAVQFTYSGLVYQSVAHNGTVTIADPPQSIFDPQAWFLYLILLSAIGGVAYFVWNTWIKTVLPKKPKQRKDINKREPASSASGTASNYEEWIPQHHLKKENTPRKRKSGKVVSPGSLSS